MTSNGLSKFHGILFGLGMFGGAGPTTVLAQLQLYFTKFLGYDPVIVGNVRGVSVALDAFLDPLMGYISDRTPGRFGRRMPYIALGSLVYAAGVIGMWFAPAGLTHAQFYVYLIVMQVVFSIGLTMTGIPFTALVPEIATGYSARTALASWMQAGAYLGNIWGGCIRWYSSWRGDEIAGFQEFALYSSAVMIVCYWLFAVLVREPPLSPGQRLTLEEGRRAGGTVPSLRAALARHVNGILRALGYAFRDRYFIILFLAVFVYQAGILAGLWMYTFLLDDWFGRTWNTPFAQRVLVGPLSPLRDAFFLYIFFAIGCGVLFLPVWNALGKRLEKRTCLSLGIVGIGLVYGSSYFLFAPKSFPLLIVYCLLQAFFYCAAYVFPTSMLADIATHSEWQRGGANEGMFYGANSFLTKLYNAASIFWTGFALKYVVQYQEGPDAVQSAETLWRMRVLYAAPACAAAFIALLVLFRYDLSRERMNAITEDLQRRKGGAAQPGA
ncbi:MAG TPA: MFS transporter [Candidatus Hydrogenedentes bacterium]|nr:MFS transporter [Candidatus Hydrogenedentota bacterium]